MMIKDRYKIIDKIGTGSYGEVFKCIDKETNQQVAIKKLKFDRKKLEEQVPFFKREISIMKKLNHKNVVKMIQQFQFNKEVYIVTEFCQKGDLLHYIRQAKDQLSKIEILTLYKQIVEALVYIHDSNIMHRDLKPQNIFIAKDNTIKIGDFGMCKVEDSKSGLLNTQQVGTPMYSAPNILQSQGDYSLKCDVFSVGLLLWFMIKKSHFFQNARNIFHLRDQHQQMLKKQKIQNVIQGLDCDSDFKKIFKSTLIFQQKYRISAKQLQTLVADIIQNIAKNMNTKKKSPIFIKKKGNLVEGQSIFISKDQIKLEKRNKLEIIKQTKTFLIQSKNLFQQNKSKYLSPLTELEKMKVSYPLDKIKIYVIMFLKINLFITDITLLLEKYKKQNSRWKDEYETDRSLYLDQISDYLKQCNQECTKLAKIIKVASNNQLIKRNNLQKILNVYDMNSGAVLKLSQVKYLFQKFFISECNISNVKDNQITRLHMRLKQN